MQLLSPGRQYVAGGKLHRSRIGVSAHVQCLLRRAMADAVDGMLRLRPANEDSRSERADVQIVSSRRSPRQLRSLRGRAKRRSNLRDEGRPALRSMLCAGTMEGVLPTPKEENMSSIEGFRLCGSRRERG